MKMMAKLFRDEKASNNTESYKKNNADKNSLSSFNIDNIKGDPDVTEAIKTVAEIGEIVETGKCQDSSNSFEAKL